MRTTGKGSKPALNPRTKNGVPEGNSRGAKENPSKKEGSRA